MPIKINDIISYFPSNGDPEGDWHQLSSDVGVITGDSRLWLFDVGSDDNVVEFINDSDKPFSAIISHFHPDHMLNIKNLKSGDIYMSKNTYKYYVRDYENDMRSKQNIIILDNDLYVQDGVSLHMFRLPSSHSKGSIALEINNEYVFLGDGIYPGHRGCEEYYNQQLLHEEIELLKNIKTKHVLLSHKDRFVYDKATVLRLLEKIQEKNT